MNPMDLKEFNGAIGLPISSTLCCLKDDDGNIVTGDDVGELCVKGPQVMRGYWKRPDETAGQFTGDFLRTGDVAVAGFGVTAKSRFSTLLLQLGDEGAHG